MKRILALGMSILLAAPIISTSMVFAEGGGTSGSSKPATPTTTIETPKTVATTETEKPAGTDDAKALQARLELHKTELKIKLSAIEKLNIQNKCKAAQGLISSVKGRANGLETSRTEIYKNITSRLADLSAKLKNRQADTTVLDADIAMLQTKIVAFNSDFAAYKQDVADVADIVDCKTDPDAFKATLMAARTAQEKVSKDAQAVHGYVTDTIKPLLATIRADLEKKTAGGQ